MSDCFQCGAAVAMNQKLCYDCDEIAELCNAHSIRIDRDHWCAVCVSNRMGQGTCPTCDAVLKRCPTRGCGKILCDDIDHRPLSQPYVDYKPYSHDMKPERLCTMCRTPITCTWCETVHMKYCGYDSPSTPVHVACRHPWCIQCSFVFSIIESDKTHKRMEIALVCLIVFTKRLRVFPKGVDRMIASYVMTPGMPDGLSCCTRRLSRPTEYFEISEDLRTKPNGFTFKRVKRY